MKQMTSPFLRDLKYQFCMQMGIAFLLQFWIFSISADELAAPIPAFEKGLTINLDGGIKMEFVLIGTGSFMMGSEKDGNDEKPVHKVTFSKPFYIGKYEVTQEQWQAVMGVNPSNFSGAKNPVELVSWDDCQGFLAKLNNKFSNKEFSLPSEAQWEYACRAGSTSDYCYGNGDGSLGEIAWITGNSNNATHPVGEKKPNVWGLYDMHGNVWEWCQDLYHETYEGAPANGGAWLQPGSYRICRGGCWVRGSNACRSSLRFWFMADTRCNYLGLRLVLAEEK